MLCLKSSSLLSCAILLTVAAGAVDSKYKHHLKSNRGIAVHKQIATWEEAKLLCESEGATLASPINEAVLQYMRAIITVNNHTTPYFIGFKAKNNTEYRSEEGVLLEDVPEVFDMVDQIDPLEGDCLCMDGHSIRVEPCWSRLPFICYTNETSRNTTIEIIPTTTPTAITCKPCESCETCKTCETCKPCPCDCNFGYQRYPTGFYRMHAYAVPWDTAKLTCEAEGAHLVIIDNSAEARIVAGIINGYSHVGLQRLPGSHDWITIKGQQVETVYNVWHNDHSAGICGVLYQDKLDDYHCDHVFPFVCEK